MTKEAFGFLLRDIPVRYRRVGYAFAAAVLLYQAAPVLAAVLAAPAKVEILTTRMDAFESRLARDSARQQRILCLQEVVAGIRPDMDLTTRCAE